MCNIRLTNISKSYKNKDILKNVNLTIGEGNFVVISGQSGSGKSTLLNIIGGLEKPTSGSIFIGSKNLSEILKKQRSVFYQRTVNFIHQGFYLHPQLTIRENISLPGIFANLKQNELKKRTQKIATDLNIVEILDRTPSEISGGQAERACIGRSIFMQPKIILADEPTNNLDDQNVKQLISLLKTAQQITHATIIVATHDQRLIAEASHVFTISEGKIYENI